MDRFFLFIKSVLSLQLFFAADAHVSFGYGLFGTQGLWEWGSELVSKFKLNCDCRGKSTLGVLFEPDVFISLIKKYTYIIPGESLYNTDGVWVTRIIS